MEQSSIMTMANKKITIEKFEITIVELSVIIVLFFVIAFLFIASCRSIHNLAAFVARFRAALSLLVVLGKERFERQTTSDKRNDEDDENHQKSDA